jgi:hypothetical protein
MKQRPRVAGDPAIKAPPALDITSLPAEDSNRIALATIRAMVENAWPAFLAAFSFVISTNLSEDLFVDVLASYQALTNVAGMLNLPTPRDAFLASLAKFAIPTRVVSGVDAYLEPPTPRTASSLTENLGLSGPSGPPGLSERNMACLKILISSAIFLAGSLDTSWFSLLETVQNADYVLTLKGTRGGPTGGLSAPPTIQKRASMSSAQSGSSQPPAVRHPMLSDLDPDNVMAAVQRLFDASKNMDDFAFQHFVTALCKLSLAMVGMQATPSPIASAPVSIEDLTTALHQPTLGETSLMQRRRVSGIHLQNAPVITLHGERLPFADMRSAQGISRSTSWEAWLCRTCTDLSIDPLKLHGTLSSRIFCQSPRLPWSLKGSGFRRQRSLTRSSWSCPGTLQKTRRRMCREGSLTRCLDKL